MAEIIRYVDPDATGLGDGSSWANAYTSWQAWDNAENTDLVSAGDIHHMYFRNIDPNAYNANIWTTDSTHYVIIEADTGEDAIKTGYSASRGGIENGGSGAVITSGVANIRFIGLQIGVDTTSGAANGVVLNGIPSGGSDIRFINCRIEHIAGSNSPGRALDLLDTDGEISLENTIIHGGFTDGFRTQGNATVYNCVVQGCSLDGIETDAGTTTVKNTAVFNCGTDFDTVTTVNFCASDDGTGTNPVSPSGLDWDNEFADYANGDFTLLNTGNLYQAGIGPSSDSNVPTTDIDGDTRSGTTCDIGADEYVAAGGLSIPVAMNHYRSMR